MALLYDGVPRFQSRVQKVLAHNGTQGNISFRIQLSQILIKVREKKERAGLLNMWKEHEREEEEEEGGQDTDRERKGLGK